MFAAHSRNARHLWVVAFTSGWLISGPAAAAGQERLSISAHFPGHPTLVALSPDGAVVATSGAVGSDGQSVGMKLWNARSGEPLLDLKQWEVASQVQGSYRFGNYVFSVIRTEARLVDVGSSTTVAFAPDRRTLVWGTESGVQCWDGATGGFRRVTHWAVEPVNGRLAVRIVTGSGLYDYVAFSPDGEVFATAGKEHEYVAAWETGTCIPIMNWKAVESGGIRAMAFAPKSRALAVIGANDTAVRLWDLKAGKLRHSFDHHGDDARAVAFSADGKVLAAAGNHIKLWDRREGTELASLDGHAGGARCLAFARGHTLISAGRDGRLKVWDADAKREIADLDAHPGRANPHVVRFNANGPIEEAAGVTSLALSNDMTTIATGGWDGCVKLWDAARFVPAHSKKKTRPAPARKVSKKKG